MVTAASVVILEDSLLRLDENFIKNFHNFDDDSWMLYVPVSSISRWKEVC